ncbi:MAG: GspE/PulE family protein [Candidatus Campbellbacteria bacterium]|nr:GspE/PulE family protein [Candidatus Campbellbacteria bacterium]
MVRFDEEKQEENLKILRSKEEEDLAKILSEKYGLKYANLLKQPVDAEAVRLIEEEKALEAKAVAFAKSGKHLGVAVTDPNKPETETVIEKLKKKGYEVEVFIVSKPSLEHAFEIYKEISSSTKTRAGVLEISEKNIENYLEKVETLEDARAAVKEALDSDSQYYVTMVIEAIIASALATDASDIHLEPEEDVSRLRFRLDGILSDVLDIDNKTHKQLLSRLKLLSGVKLNIKKSAQDGRFTISLKDKEIEVRVSMVPGENDESVVLRVLDPGTIQSSLEKLGMHPTIVDVMKREISRPNGMVLNTGPTGSGKTTTLYTFLKIVNQPEVKIITIENPIEYHLDGIVQTQTSKKGLSFASGLRSLMRQDPDIILVGEIRDSETAKIAIQAAQTGHLVFSTLHTNTAAGTFPRLIDLEANQRTIGSAVNVSMAQRLVRTLCPHCREESEMSAEEKEYVEKILADLPENVERPKEYKVYSPVGCEQCNDRGYVGRTGIFDVILLTKELEELFHKVESPSERDVLTVSEKQGILNMKQDAILKIVSGTTSFAEVKRVIDL